jgi:hypothetical protein
MTEEPADIDLHGFTQDEVRQSPPRSRGPAPLLALAGVVLLALVGGYLYLRRAPAEPAAPVEAKPSDTSSRPQSARGDQIVLPPLDETDPLIRELVGKLSSHPTVAAWLTTDGLVLNFVMVSTAIANGETRTAELKAVGPVPPFRIKESRDNRYIDPSSYRRYDRHAAATAGLDARGVARLYATLKPRIEDASRRLGNPGADFDPVMERALIELLRTPVVEGDVALEPKGIVYAFADPRLEGLTKAQKQFLRMGPQNVRSVQGKLREIADYLGIPASRLR